MIAKQRHQKATWTRVGNSLQTGGHKGLSCRGTRSFPSSLFIRPGRARHSRLALVMCTVLWPGRRPTCPPHPPARPALILVGGNGRECSLSQSANADAALSNLFALVSVAFQPESCFSDKVEGDHISRYSSRNVCMCVLVE